MIGWLRARQRTAHSADIHLGSALKNIGALSFSATFGQHRSMTKTGFGTGFGGFSSELPSRPAGTRILRTERGAGDCDGNRPTHS